MATVLSSQNQTSDRPTYDDDGYHENEFVNFFKAFFAPSFKSDGILTSDWASSEFGSKLTMTASGDGCAAGRVPKLQSKSVIAVTAAKVANRFMWVQTAKGEMKQMASYISKAHFKLHFGLAYV